MRTRCARVARGVLLNQCLHREVMASGYQSGIDRARRRVRRMTYEDVGSREGSRVGVERVASLTGSAVGLLGVEGER